MELKLSILVPSVHTRRDSFLPKSLDMLYSQYDRLSEDLQNKVEILYLIDNKTMFLGQKRNNLVDLAQGEYIVFVDDDDRIAENYISCLIDAIETGADVITFHAEVTINGKDKKLCKYSKEYKIDQNTETEYLRIPNHICCVKKQLAQKVSFPNKIYGEDSAYSKGLIGLLKTEYVIPSILYYYDFNTETTETQTILYIKEQQKRNYTIDVIILSNAKTPELKQMTQETVNSCLETAGSTNIRITVIEQNPRVFYRGARVKQPENESSFNYNERMNQGILISNAEYVLLANNDLIFNEGWAQELLKANYPVVSPICPKDPRHVGLTKNEKGSVCGRNFSGFCFMIKRELWNQLPQERLQEFPFFYADNVVVEELLKIGIEPMVVPSAVVRHLGSTTLKTLPNQEQQELMWAQTEKYNKMYNKKLFEDNQDYIRWKKQQFVS